MTLDETLKQFDNVEANLARLEKVWSRIEQAIPGGITFDSGSPERRAYEDLCRSFKALRDALPPIDGWRIDTSPLGWDEIAQARFDAQEIDEPDCYISTERAIYGVADGVHEYRFRFNKTRRHLVRAKAHELIEEIDSTLKRLRDTGVARESGTSMAGPDWAGLVESVAQIERLHGSGERRGRWSHLHRHLDLAMAVDLFDIIEHDWPSVRQDIEASLYNETEPVPVAIDDLALVAGNSPKGPVTTSLQWDRLSDEQFERLVFCVISDATGYENAQWLTKTRAPDRGRDLSVDRVVTDTLSGCARKRVVIQCKHWLSRSVATGDVAEACGQMELWDAPPVDVLVIATSGRFSTDAVEWIENHNYARKLPAIEMWPESHLERLLAPRPHLVAEFGLR